MTESTAAKVNSRTNEELKNEDDIPTVFKKLKKWLVLIFKQNRGLTPG